MVVRAEIGKTIASLGSPEGVIRIWVVWMILFFFVGGLSSVIRAPLTFFGFSLILSIIVNVVRRFI